MDMEWFNLAYEIFPFLFVAGLSVWAYLSISKWWANYQRQKRLNKGRNAESEARDLLEKKGFEVIDYHPKLNYHFKDDKEAVKVDLTPDFLAKRSGRTFVVEVKTGQSASDPSYTPTRRQLLEYVVSSNYPLLFVDMESRTIREIEFPFAVIKNRINWWKYFSLLIIASVSVACMGMAIVALLKML